jgi:hydrogenase expression/formation protein HypC
MCLGVPAKVVEVKGDTARVTIGEVTYTANISLLDELTVGDYIILHAGFAIEKLDPEEAAETFRLIDEMERSGEDHP